MPQREPREHFISDQRKDAYQSTEIRASLPELEKLNTVEPGGITTDVIYAPKGNVVSGVLTLEYKNKHKPELIQFGFVILKLDEDGQTLDGHFVGFGPRTRSIVWGSLQLHKKM